MNKSKIKILSSIGGLAALTGVLLSFQTEVDPPLFKKYEVIRTMDGVVTVYDTLINSSAEYSPMDYLSELGFGDDENVSVIEFSQDLSNFEYNFELHHKFMQENGDSIVEFEMIQLHHEMAELDSEMVRLQYEMRQLNFENHMIIFEMDSMHEINEYESHKWNHEHSDSMLTFDFIMDSTEKEFFFEFSFDSMQIEEIQQMHFDMDSFEFHKMAYRDLELGDANSTIIIVTEGFEELDDKKRELLSNEGVGQLDIFPNPANDEVSFNFTLRGVENTSVFVTDTKGNVVHEVDLGEIGGAHTMLIDVSGWAKGLYFVHVERPNGGIIRKLIVE